MANMTDEEAKKLDEKWTKNLNTKAVADHKTPSQIIGEMLRERIAASAASL